MGSNFVKYVGDPDIHDGVIVKVEHHADKVSVLLKGGSGKMLTIEFSGVKFIKANKPEGMILYSLSEMSCEKPHRQFVFTNTEDSAHAFLEIVAENFRVIKAA